MKTQSLLNCIRARVGAEPRFVAGVGWRRGQGLVNGVWRLHSSRALAPPWRWRGSGAGGGGGIRMFSVVTWQTEVAAWCWWLGFAAKPDSYGT